MNLNKYFQDNQGILAALGIFIVVVFEALKDHWFLSFSAYFLSFMLIAYLTMKLRQPKDGWFWMLSLGYSFLYIALLVFGVKEYAGYFNGITQTILIGIAVFLYGWIVIRNLWQTTSKIKLKKTKKMSNFFTEYYGIVKSWMERSKFWTVIFPIVLATIAAVYINIFTSAEWAKEFINIPINIPLELFFNLGFGLVALISLMRAFISTTIIMIIGLIVGFLMFLIHKLHQKLLEASKIISKPLILIILMLIELALAAYFLILSESKLNSFFLLTFLVLFLAIDILIPLSKNLPSRNNARTLPN